MARKPIDVSPDGRTVWVGNNGSQDIDVFDAETMKKLSRIDIGFLPIRLQFHPDGQSVAVSDIRGDRVVIYDAGSHDVITEIDLSVGRV